MGTHLEKTGVGKPVLRIPSVKRSSLFPFLTDPQSSNPITNRHGKCDSLIDIIENLLKSDLATNSLLLN